MTDYPGKPDDLSIYPVDIVVAKEFAESLVGHITSFREAARKLKVSSGQALNHDVSKWSIEEFPHYARRFHKGSSRVDAAQVSANFARAWLHHIHHNEHHWQHWVFPDGYSPRGSGTEDGVVEMPEPYVREMVADWMGASKAYTGSWDMETWLAKNLPKIDLHSKSWGYLGDVLDKSGYAIEEYR